MCGTDELSLLVHRVSDLFFTSYSYRIGARAGLGKSRNDARLDATRRL